MEDAEFCPRVLGRQIDMVPAGKQPTHSSLARGAVHTVFSVSGAPWSCAFLAITPTGSGPFLGKGDGRLDYGEIRPRGGVVVSSV